MPLKDAVQVGHRYMTSHNRVVDITGTDTAVDKESGDEIDVATGSMWEVGRLGVAGENQRWRMDGSFGITGVPSQCDLVQHMGVTP